MTRTTFAGWIQVALAAGALAGAGTAVAQDADSADAAEQAEIDGLEPGVDTSAAAEPAPAGTDEGETPDDEETAAEEVTRTESGGYVMDRMELGRTEITGNQELPKVLYIVPWQKAQHGDLSGRPVNTLLDEVLAPVDRDEFIRTVDYYEELHGRGE